MRPEILRHIAPVTFHAQRRETRINMQQVATAMHEFDHAAVGESVGEVHEISAIDQGNGTKGFVRAKARNPQGQIAIAMASTEGGHSGTGWDRFISRVIELETRGSATVERGKKIARGIIYSIPQQVREAGAKILLHEYKGHAIGGQFSSIKQQAYREVEEMGREQTLLRRVESKLKQSGVIFDASRHDPRQLLQAA